MLTTRLHYYSAFESQYYNLHPVVNVCEVADVEPAGYQAPIICYNASDTTDVEPVGYQAPIICYNASEIADVDVRSRRRNLSVPKTK